MGPIFIVIGGALILAALVSSNKRVPIQPHPKNPMPNPNPSNKVWGGYESALASDPQGVTDVLSASKDIVNPLELAWIIEIESRWNPAAKNPMSSAAGLIQMLGSTQKMLGISNVGAMTRTEQAPHIRNYFVKVLRGRKLTIPGDTYMAVFSPDFIGKAGNSIMYDVGTKAWEQNAGYRSPNNGPILVGTVRSRGTPPGMPPSGIPINTS